MSQPRILAFAGSARKDSFNKKLIKVAAEGARKAGADVTLIDLADFPLPVFDQDLEAREFPENAKKLKALFVSHAGLLISCPEYNSSMTPLLKNTIDWVSRPLPGEKSLAGIAGKAAGLVSASPGALGGLRGLVPVRAMFGNIQVLVVPEQAAVPAADKAFEEDGTLKDPKMQGMVENVGAALTKLLVKLGV